MQIRRLETEDVDMYRSIMLRAFDIHPDAFISSVADGIAKPRAWWESRVDPNPLANELVYGAILDSKLVGVAGISFDTREKARHKATVFGMFVLPQARGSKVALELLNSVMAEARSRDHVCVVQLTVTQGNASAEKLYQGAGFKQFGVEPLAVQVGPSFVSKVHMWCDLTQK